MSNSNNKKENDPSELLSQVFKNMEHAVAVFDSNGLLNLQKMREEQKRVNENFIV